MILLCPFGCKRPVTVKLTMPTEHGTTERVYCRNHGEQVVELWERHFAPVTVEAWSSESCDPAPRSRDESSPSPASG